MFLLFLAVCCVVVVVAVVVVATAAKAAAAAATAAAAAAAPAGSNRQRSRCRRVKAPPGLLASWAHRAQGIRADDAWRRHAAPRRDVL